jgi:isoleucyl-tRNA synthetase
MHAISNELFGRLAFKNVLTTGTILAADGNKLSKSKKNYTDPYHLFDQYGADAFRYYLMSSVVMQAEDLTFRDEDVKDAHARVVNMLRNVLTFYKLFKTDHDQSVAASDSPHVLDRWILVRLHELTREMTDAFDRYDVTRATRPIKSFVDELSTWYVRRSRERVKGGNEADKKFALATLHHVLTELALVIAPVLPFVAEEIYTEVKAATDAESVHLASWPEEPLHKKAVRVLRRSAETKLISDMNRVRALASDVLQLRQKAGIKVRQPLHKLSVPENLSKELALVLAEEVNVKQVRTGAASVELDTTLTPELVQEGDVREFTRALADARKTLELSPKDVVSLTVSKEGEKTLEDAVLPGVKTISFSELAEAPYSAELSSGAVRFSITVHAP